MRKRTEPEAEDLEPEQSVEETVHAAADEIARRFDARYPDPEALAQDPDFLRAGGLLARRDVPFDTVWKLERATVPVVAAIAHRATALRDDVPPEWLEWAYPRLTRVYAGELMGLLDAIERHGEPPLLARVLARCDDDWSDGWCGGVITAFVARRVAAGESPTAAELDEAVEPGRRTVVDDVVESLQGTLPEETYRDLERRKTRRFLESVGRVWERPADLPALPSVGGREDVALAVQDAVGDSPPRSVLVVGEHGVGKSAVLRSALADFLDEGWLVFEAGAPEIHAGCGYIGQLESRVREIASYAGARAHRLGLPAVRGRALGRPARTEPARAPRHADAVRRVRARRPGRRGRAAGI